MESKEKMAINVMEKKHVLRLIVFVKEHPGCSKSDAIKSLKGSDRTKFLRIDELIEYGFFFEDDAPRRSNTKKLYLTPKGQELALLIEKIFGLFPTA